jgi:alpha-1,2-mannosyltransferase
MEGFNGKSVGGLRNRLEDALPEFARPWEVAIFLWLPFSLLALVVFAALYWSKSLGDWEIFRTAALAVVHGRSPFGAADAATLAHNDQFVYPPSTALALGPLALLPDVAGRVVVLLLAIACVFVSLRLLEVRDWRCYGLAVATAPVVDNVSLGALSSLLLLGVAAAWSYRRNVHGSAAAVAVTAASKLFLWPLGVWLLVTRRVRATIEAAAVATAFLLAGWVATGFAGLRTYPHLLRTLSGVEAGQSYSLAGLLRLSGAALTGLSVVLVAVVVAAVALAGRGEDGDRRALAVAVAGALLATPVLWLHYFVLLLVPIALYRPRLSAVWFVPLAFWVTPIGHSDGSVWKAAFALTCAAVTVIAALATQLEPWRRVTELGKRRRLSASWRVPEHDHVAVDAHYPGEARA